MEQTLELENLTEEEIAEKISNLFEKKEYRQIREILVNINPADLPGVFEEFETDKKILLFRLMPKEEAAETFVELDGDVQEALITAFSDTIFSRN